KNPQVKRDLVVVSGYYGFGNLGDEAILEELTNELKKILGGVEKIVVLSAKPEETQSTFGIQARDPWPIVQLLPLLKRTQLFVSGGGGLFQDATSLRSVYYYWLLIALARLSGARAVIYAHGLGPLKTHMGKKLTRAALSLADGITVRDSSSLSL